MSLLVSHTSVTSHKWDAQSLDAVEGSYYRATASVTTSKVTSEVVFSYSYAMATFDVVWINPLWDLFTVLPNSRYDDIKAGLDRAIPPTSMDVVEAVKPVYSGSSLSHSMFTSGCWFAGVFYTWLAANLY